MRYLAKTFVRWDDLDAFGHVNNASYLTYAQEARSNFTWYSRKTAGLEPLLLHMVVARAEVDFIEPIYNGGFDSDPNYASRVASVLRREPSRYQRLLRRARLEDFDT